ncbi:MAG: hypothetical protein LBN95_07015 [Prevotellaceae bacterium]|jgi:hypothetical protein|nr:hypothetical protein [Prevotellaceae bacterium]
MKKEIEIIVKDGEQEFSCKVHRPDVATLSRVNKLSKADEVLAAQELLKGCWISGDTEIQNDGYLLMAAVGQMGALNESITGEIKN